MGGFQDTFIRLGVEKNRLWRRVVALKFGEDWGGWTSSWEGVARAVVCGEVFGWAGRFLTKISSIRLEWGIE